MNGAGYDSLAGFSAELDAAVARARRVAAESRETSARFRRETRQLADRTRAGAVRPASETDLTAEHLRRAATGFRADNGLPVASLPSGPELLGQTTNGPTPPPVTASGPRFTPPGRRNPYPDDDDEDFSQERIMF
jgi:hypothetical protein